MEDKFDACLVKLERIEEKLDKLNSYYDEDEDEEYEAEIDTRKWYEKTDWFWMAISLMTFASVVGTFLK